jgi:hypothetical protein
MGRAQPWRQSLLSSDFEALADSGGAAPAPLCVDGSYPVHLHEEHANVVVELIRIELTTS